MAASGLPHGSYVGTDSRAPGLQLPASFLTLPLAADLDDEGTIADAATLAADGEDAKYSFDFNQGGSADVYGSNLGTCDVHVNGYIECGGVGDSPFVNRPLGGGELGGSFAAAAYWDDLVPVAGLSTITYQRKDASFISVQWNDMALATNPAARLTFRATIQQDAPGSNGFVLFQYIKMTGTSSDGSRATIGVEANSIVADTYSYNRVGAVLNGTAGAGLALQAILFDFDEDGDRLVASLEAIEGSDPTLIDTDSGGLDDGAEVAGGKDPTMSADDAAGTDADADGLAALDEAFYGTNPASADTDSDAFGSAAVQDDDELFTLRTDPVNPDTDGDGYSDGVEVELASDPLDPNSIPSAFTPLVNLAPSGTRLTEPRAVLDASGHIHVVANDWTGTNRGVWYGMFDAAGATRIPLVLLQSPANRFTRQASLSHHAGKIYIAYNACVNASYDCTLQFVRLAPATAPQDGTAVTAASLTEVATQVTLPGGGAMAGSDMAAAATGVHIAYMRHNTNGVDHQRRRSVRWLGTFYTRLDLDGNPGIHKVVMTAPGSANRAHASRGVRIAVDPAGTAHVLAWGHPGRNSSPFPLYWMSVKPTEILGPYHVPGANTERGADVKFSGTNVVIAYNGGARHSGIGVLSFDPATITTLPRSGDRYGIGTSIDPASMTTSASLLGTGGRSRGANLYVDSSNNRYIVGYSTDSELCFQAATFAGLRLGRVQCGYSRASNRWHYSHPTFPLPGNRVGFVIARTAFNNRFTPQPLRLGSIDLDGLFAATALANEAPTIASTPPTSATVGAPYTYAVSASDDGGAANLTWSFLSAPTGMTISSLGVISWTPTPAQEAEWPLEIRVCDAQGECDEQKWTITMPNGGQNQAPAFVSAPPTVAEVGVALSYTAMAIDPNNDVLTYALRAPNPVPAGLTFSNAGTLSWTPTTTNLGTHVLTLEVEDTNGLTAQQMFSITVVPQGSLVPPAGAGFAFTSLPPTSAVVGRDYAYQAVAADPNDPSATMTYELASSGLADLAVTTDGLLTWIPREADRGTVTITLRATTASGKVATQSYTVSVLGAPGGDGCTCATGSSTPPVWLALLVGLVVLRRRRRPRVLALVSVLVLLGVGAAHANHGPRDAGGYVGIDSRPPQITLPASFLTLSTGETSTATVANATTLMSNGDDFAYSVAMPAGAGMYGNTLSACWAHTNGVLQCGTQAAATFSNSSMRSAFPGSTAAAPFWDDLVPVAAVSSITSGTRNNEWFYVQWNDFALLSDSAARLTFRVQIRLDNTARRGSVLFQYIRMELGTDADGRRATIGIRSAVDGVFNDYSVNTTGAVLTGAAGATALQAIVFDFDTDADRIGDSVETALGTDPALRDTDTGNTDDGAELVNGTDPLAIGDDAPGLDGDGDGLFATNEAFYGTNPALADTDGDSVAGGSANDAEELTDGTNPLLADTDGDSFIDGAEKRDGTNPLDASDPSQLGIDYDVAGRNKHFPQITGDANGDLHAVGTSREGNFPGIFYYMIGDDASSMIPETLLKSIADDADQLQRANVAAHNGKVYITYEIRHATAGSQLSVLVVNPALAPRDGTPVTGASITEAQYVLTLAAFPKNHDMSVGPNGIHVTYTRATRFDQTNNGFNGDGRGFGYVHINFNGTIAAQHTLIVTTGGRTDDSMGFHNNSHARVAVDTSGIAHVLLHVQRGQPYRAQSQARSGAYYARIGSQVSGPYYIGDGRFERADLDVGDGLVTVFGTAGGNNFGTLRSRMAVLTTGALATIPRIGDVNGVGWAVDPESFVLPWTVVADDGKNAGAQVRALPGGKMVIVGYIHKNDGRYCLRGIAYNGTPVGSRRCITNVDDRGHRFANIALAGGNQIGIAVRNSSETSSFPVGLISRILFPQTGLTVPTLPPAITSIAPTIASVGSAFSYTPTAVDPDTAASSLSWTAPVKPGAMTISSTGVLSWTPTASDIGAHAVTLRTCDPQNHCASQLFVLTVPAPGAPAITSTPSLIALAGYAYKYQLVVSDPDQNGTTFTIVAPQPALGDMAISATGLFTWTPSIANIGGHTITLQVTDDSGMSGMQTFTLGVIDPNSTPSTAREPMFVSVPSTVAMYARTYTYQALATDPIDPNVTMTYELASTPSGDMAVDATTGMLSWTPEYDERATIPVAIRATSSTGASAVQTFSVTVITEPTYGCCSTSRGSLGGPFTGALMALFVLLGLRRRRGTRA